MGYFTCDGSERREDLMVVEVWPLPSMGGATSWRSQGRVIAVSSSGYEGSRFPPSVPELGVCVASFVVSNNEGIWIPISELGSAPPAPSVRPLSKHNVLLNGILRLLITGAICRLDSNVLDDSGEKGS